MLDSISDASCNQASLSESYAATASFSTQSSDPAPKTQPPLQTPQTPRKLPYQKDQQLKLLNLEAETEALLQQLYRVQQQRQADQRDDLNEANRQPLIEQERVLSQSRA